MPKTCCPKPRPSRLFQTPSNSSQDAEHNETTTCGVDSVRCCYPFCIFCWKVGYAVWVLCTSKWGWCPWHVWQCYFSGSARSPAWEPKMCIGAQGAIDVGTWQVLLHLVSRYPTSQWELCSWSTPNEPTSPAFLSCQAARARAKFHCERGGCFGCFSSGGQKSS